MNFSNDEWGEWVDFYGGCFGWLSDADLRMFDAWRQVFAASGYTIVELRDAAKALAANPPKWRSDHLARIHQRVRESRLVEARRQERELREQNERKPCSQCFGSGLVIVPHLVGVQNGKWLSPWHEFGVACDCPKGQAVRGPLMRRRAEWEEAGKKGKEPLVLLTLTDYDLRNPFWRDQVWQREQARVANEQAREASTYADRLSLNFSEGLEHVKEKAIEDQR